MADTLTGDLATQPRGIEIKHFENVDIIQNHTASDPITLEQLTKAWQNGIPADWQPHHPTNYFRPEEAYSGELYLYIDNTDLPQYLAKKRRNSSPLDVKKIKSMADKRSYEEYFAFKTNSLINEIRLSPKIRDLLGTDEAHGIAKRYGFAGISFVEPLIGVIDRPSGNKYTVYPWIQPDYSGDTWKHISSDGNARYGFLKRIKELLEGHGIEVDDFNIGQFLPEAREDGYYLNLIDIEAYRNMSR